MSILLLTREHCTSNVLKMNSVSTFYRLVRNLKREEIVVHAQQGIKKSVWIPFISESVIAQSICGQSSREQYLNIYFRLKHNVKQTSNSLAPADVCVTKL